MHEILLHQEETILDAPVIRIRWLVIGVRPIMRVRFGRKASVTSFLRRHHFSPKPGTLVGVRAFVLSSPNESMCGRRV